MLSLKHHPVAQRGSKSASWPKDKNQDDVEAATERFQSIKDAYNAIKVGC